VELRLSQTVLFLKFLNEHLVESIAKQPWSINDPKINKIFVDDIFYRTNLKEFMNSFGDWLKEMSNNTRGFSPFNLDSSLETLIKDRTPTSGWWSKVDYVGFDKMLNSKSKGKMYISSQQKMIKLFFDSTEEILTSKFGLKN
jgi:hypothetical protein